MSGNQTHNHDMVIEFAENALSKMLEPLFGGENGLLGELVEKVGLNFPGGQFFIDTLFDRPSNVNLPANAPNPVDIRVHLGVSGISGQIRIVVGLSVDRSNPNEDAIQLDFTNELYLVATTVDVPVVGIVTTRWQVVEDWLRTQAPLRLPGFSVDRATVDPITPKQIDVVVIDDTSGEDRDAMAFCITFGGGGGDSLSNFTKSFIPVGETGALVIFFGWLCRIISPKIAESLGVTSEEFSNCTLHKTIDVGDGAKLTKLEIRLDGEFIKVNAEVKKSGTCYSAKGKVNAKIKISVETGQLVVQSEIGDPDVDVDIPWYCYLAAAVIGVVVGGFIVGVVGPIVGGIIAVIITYIIHEVIEKIFQKVVDALREKINSSLPNFSIPAYGLNFVFQEVHIDDITIMFDLEVIDNTPIRCAGTATLYLGQGIDLDSGTIGDYDQPGMDMAWIGKGDNRAIKTICITQLGRTGSKSFYGQTQFSLYRSVYAPQISVPVTELETITYHWWAPFRINEPTLWTYGVITNEKRWAIAQAVQIEDNYVVLRYRTYDTISPSVKIENDLSFWFPQQVEQSSSQIYIPLKPPKNDDERVAVLVEALGKKAENLMNTTGLPVSREAYSRCETLKGMITSRISSDIIQLGDAPAPAKNRKLLNNRMLIYEAMQLAAPRACRVGEWSETRTYQNPDLMVYIAYPKNIKNPVKYYWYVNGLYLDKNTGQVVAGQQIFAYTVSDNHVTLNATKIQKTTFELKVKAVGVDGTDAETTRCLIFKPKYELAVQKIPSYKDYLKAYKANFGSVTTAKFYAAQVLPST